MIALSTTTAAAIALHAAEGSWIIFLQVVPPIGNQGPIKIEGLKGTQLASRLTTIAKDCPYEIRLIGLIPTTNLMIDAETILTDYENSYLRDGWFNPSDNLLQFIQDQAQEALQQLLAQTHPGGLSNDIVDIKGIAAILNVSVPTIRRMISAEQIPYLRWGKIYRFVPTDVIASLQGNR